MSKKNIARTAIEGGRASRNRDAEKEDTRGDRRYTRRYLGLAAKDPMRDEPVRRVRGDHWDLGRSAREFDDRLNPVRRWLESQVNRPWNKVYSEICKKFDRRSLAGRHILDHIKWMVTLPNDPYFTKYRRDYSSGELYVDKHGILKRAPLKRRMRYPRTI